MDFHSTTEIPLKSKNCRVGLICWWEDYKANPRFEFRMVQWKNRLVIECKKKIGGRKVENILFPLRYNYNCPTTGDFRCCCRSGSAMLVDSDPQGQSEVEELQGEAAGVAALREGLGGGSAWCLPAPSLSHESSGVLARGSDWRVGDSDESAYPFSVPRCLQVYRCMASVKVQLRTWPRLLV